MALLSDMISSVTSLVQLPEAYSSLFCLGAFSFLYFFRLLIPSTPLLGGIALVILGISRALASGGKCKIARPFRGPHVSIVTGAASGIGFETARELGQLGSTVVIGVRGQKRAEKVADQLHRALGLPPTANRFIGLDLDLSSFSSVLDFCSAFQSRFQSLNLLVNNAGIMMCPYTISADGLELQMATNHFGHFLLTQQLMNYLQSSRGRIVNLASIAHWFAPNGIDLDSQYNSSTYDPTVAYGMSKLANIWFSRELNRRYSSKGIRSFAVHPGVVATELARHNPLFKFLFAIRLIFFKTPLEGAQSSLHCCFTDEEPAIFYADCAPAPCSRWAKDADEAKRFWEVSDKIVKERTARFRK